MGRLPWVIRRKYQLQSLSAKHHEVKRLDVLGTSHTEIAHILDCTPESICQITGSELYKRERQAMEVARDCATIEIGQAIAREGPKCLKLLTDIRDNVVPDEHANLMLRAKVAEGLMDRNPQTAKVKQVQGDIRHSHAVVLTTLETIKQRARAAKELAIAQEV